jgi:DNA-binding CsgD family transcriptional regulator
MTDAQISEVEELAEVLSLMASHSSPVRLCQALSQTSLLSGAGASVIGLELFRLSEKGQFSSVGLFGARADPFQPESQPLGYGLGVAWLKTGVLSYADLDAGNRRLVRIPLMANFPVGVLAVLYESIDYIPVISAHQIRALGSAAAIYLDRVSLSLAADPKITKFSARQLEVLNLLATGLTNQEIANELGKSHSTIRQATIAIYSKLGVSSRGAAVAVAKSRGLT